MGRDGGEADPNAESAATEEGVTVTEKWVVVWFPPDAPERERRFDTERAARRFAASADVAVWNPLLDHRITTSWIVSELVPLEALHNDGMVRPE